MAHEVAHPKGAPTTGEHRRRRGISTPLLFAAFGVFGMYLAGYLVLRGTGLLVHRRSLAKHIVLIPAEEALAQQVCVGRIVRAPRSSGLGGLRVAGHAVRGMNEFLEDLYTPVRLLEVGWWNRVQPVGSPPAELTWISGGSAEENIAPEARGEPPSRKGKKP